MTRRNNIIEKKLTAAMLRRGWSRRSVSGLPAAYAKDKLVTPFFFCSNVREKLEGQYAIDGSVGIIDQAFEAVWAEDPDNVVNGKQFALSLHIANVNQLNESRLLAGTRLDSEIEKFAMDVSDFLDQMPQNMAALISSFRSNDMQGFSIAQYAGYSGRRKFAAFKAYMDNKVALDKP